MIRDIAKGVVLEALKDENLAYNYKNEVLEQLRRLPPEWRQNALAERTRRESIGRGRHVQMSGEDFIVDSLVDLNSVDFSAIVDEILEGLK